MDYCDECGQAAVFRCPIDGTYTCSSHMRAYPFALHQYLEHTEHPGRGRNAPIPVRRADGTTRTMHSEFNVCATCCQAAEQQLPRRGAAALNRKFDGSREHAFVDIVSGLEYPTNFSTTASLEGIAIRAMSDPPPPWFKHGAVDSLAALYAHAQKCLGNTAPPVRLYSSFRGWEFWVNFKSGEGYPLTSRAWVLSDGRLKVDSRIQPSAQIPDDNWFRTDYSGHYGDETVALFESLLGRVRRLIAGKPAETFIADADDTAHTAFDDYLIQALGHHVHRELSPSIKDRIRDEPELRRTVDSLFNENWGPRIDQDSRFAADLIRTFQKYDSQA